VRVADGHAGIARALEVVDLGERSPALGDELGLELLELALQAARRGDWRARAP
jgi:hypothetical protein